MKQTYEKPDVELLTVKVAHFFCTNPAPASESSGLKDLDGEAW